MFQGGWRMTRAVEVREPPMPHRPRGAQSFESPHSTAAPVTHGWPSFLSASWPIGHEAGRNPSQPRVTGAAAPCGYLTEHWPVSCRNKRTGVRPGLENPVWTICPNKSNTRNALTLTCLEGSPPVSLQVNLNCDCNSEYTFAFPICALASLFVSRPPYPGHRRSSNHTGMQCFTLFPAIRPRFRFPGLRCSFDQLRTFYLLMRLMCVVQAGPQQAAGVAGYPQFPFLNAFDSDAAATIVAFCDAAIHFAQTNVEVHKAT